MSLPSNYGNWLSILKWSIAQQGDGTQPSEFTEMDHEKRKWLEEAMESMTVDEVQLMVKYSDRIVAKAEDGDDLEEFEDTKVELLEMIQDLVGSYDNSKNYFIVGAFARLLSVLRGYIEEDGEQYNGKDLAFTYAVRTKAFVVLASLVQNNPQTQQWAMQAGTYEIVLDALSGKGIPATDEYTPAIADYYAAVVYALSSLVRDNKKGQARLVANEGKDLLCLCSKLGYWTKALSDGSSERFVRAAMKLVRRTLFTLLHLSSGSHSPQVLAFLADSQYYPSLQTFRDILDSVKTPTGEEHFTQNHEIFINVLLLLKAVLSEPVVFEGVEPEDLGNNKPIGLFDEKKKKQEDASAPPLLLTSGAPRAVAPNKAEATETTKATPGATPVDVAQSTASDGRASSTAKDDTTRPPVENFILSKRRELVNAADAARVLADYTKWMKEKEKKIRGTEQETDLGSLLEEQITASVEVAALL